MENLQCKIERLRQEMHVTTIAKGISHPDVLRASQGMDEVINELFTVELM
ncbi:MAG: Sporulation stage 0, Spo0E-like regulatory phosphatase [Firmicutes bacterium]|nr:Sporulation stage 0, Spo0E-like regulatory phosphatase [Bacillota bacterium]